MNRLSAFLSLGLLLAGSPAQSAVPVATVTAELFPVEPGFDTQRGFAVAVDGDRMAVGAPLDDTVARDAGAVHLFQWIDGRWEPETTLYPEIPQERSRFGAALALRDGVLAVGAPGVGVVYLFRTGQDGWDLKSKVRRQDLMPGFGRSVALGGGRLAVGNVAFGGGGFVFLYDEVTASVPQPLRVFGGGPGERFGEAMALDGDTLAVGAPGFGAAAGAVYVLTKASGWKPVRLAGQKAGEQLGAAVALSGDQLAATGADRRGDGTAAVYVFERTGAKWSKPVRVLYGAGAALAMDGNLLAIGAAAPFSNRTGAVRLLRHVGESWIELSALIPGNSETHDLAGYAVAASGGRVAVGAVLGDQGGAAAGAAWTFGCPLEGDAPCIEEGEAVVRDPGVIQNVGTSLVLAGGLLAVGVTPPSPDPNAVQAVYVYRRASVGAGTGWRQEARLWSPQMQAGDDGFGSALALSRDDLLAVGAPRDPSPVSPSPLPPVQPGGTVYIYQRGKQLTWSLQPQAIHGDHLGDDLGTSVVFADDALVIGAPEYDVPNVGKAGAVAIYRQVAGVWTLAAPLLTGSQPGEQFGAAVAWQDGVLAVGAPGTGHVEIFSLAKSARFVTRRLQVPDGGLFGASLVFGNGRLVVGAPGFGIIFTFETRDFTEVGDRLQAPGFGAALAASGDKLLVGQPDQARLYQWQQAGWTPVAVTPPAVAGGAAVALDDRSFLVGSAQDRVTVYDLPAGGPP